MIEATVDLHCRSLVARLDGLARMDSPGRRETGDGSLHRVGSALRMSFRPKASENLNFRIKIAAAV